MGYINIYYEGTGSVVVHWVHTSKNSVKSQDVIEVMDLLLHRSMILTRGETVSLKERHYN